MERSRVIQDLRAIAEDCLRRKIVDISKWATELLVSLNPTEQDIRGTAMSPSTSQALSIADESILLFSQSCFDSREFSRAANACKSSSHSLLVFLRYYALYLANDKMNLDTLADIADKDKSKGLEYGKLIDLQCELQQMHKSALLDGYLLYVYGLVLRDQGLTQDAEAVFHESVLKAPLFYGSWRELAKLITSKDKLDSLGLPNCWQKQFFLGEALLSLHMSPEAFDVYSSLEAAGFNCCPYILAQMAMAQQNMQNLDAACALFAQTVELDPFRVEAMDCYSNALHVKGKRVDLASLAHSLYKIDKYCPETCCVVGNYYSLRGEHESAITYFQRAIRLDPRHASAWTLLGHEFMELKNTAAAILAYRHAIEVDKKDYKAWYGLGQLYEILKMPNYAFYYYDMAHKLRPQDSRMVIALGEMFEKQSKLEEAKRCYWKAHCIGDIEGIALLKLGRLYEKLKDSDQAAATYLRFVNSMEKQDLTDPENQSHCYKFLATYNISKKDLDKAQEFAQSCLDYESTREEAKGLLKQISQLRTEAMNNGGIVSQETGAANSSVAAHPTIIAADQDSSAIEPDDIEQVDDTNTSAS